MKRLRVFLLVFAVVFVAAQFVGPDPTNPPVDGALTLPATVDVPPPVVTILDRSCANCHSHRTRWPWYARVAPVSWLVIHDVDEAREHLDLDAFGALSAYDQQHVLEELCEEIEAKKMPLKIYLPLHPEAALDAAEIEILCNWATVTRAELRATMGTGGFEAGEDDDHSGHDH